MDTDSKESLSYAVIQIESESHGCHLAGIFGALVQPSTWDASYVSWEESPRAFAVDLPSIRWRKKSTQAPRSLLPELYMLSPRPADLPTPPIGSFQPPNTIQVQ
ncbi:hypothetical protein J6590_100323 [Homalodisca vitripennis]|nr:hypothetical protein J6590_100323 [Homalodisca vitripennis]